MSITCPVCTMTSHHPDDEKWGYCGNCHEFTSDPKGKRPNKGLMEDEYVWAKAHPDDPDAKTMIGLAQLYTAHADRPTLAFLESCAEAIRKKMKL